MTVTHTQSELDTLGAGLMTIAVTGTNGKTSTTSMLAEIVRAAGQLPVLVTTLGMWVGDEQLADDGSMASFVRTVRRGRELGARTLALEVTSRALENGFAARWPARVAAFTNLTPDHLDRHGTVERYLAAKAQLFLRLRAQGCAVLNAADPASALLREVIPAETRGRGFLGTALAPDVEPTAAPLDLAAARIECDEHTMRVELAPSDLAVRLGGCLQIQAIGEFQVDNALCAALAADSAGFDAAAIRRGLSRFMGVPGRFERCAHEPLVIVDFAHTPDALGRVLDAARALAARRAGRLACVFGCGGERDRAKRPQMGAIAARLADAVWLTTDNPRGEAAPAIAAMVRAGAFENGESPRACWHEQPDRRLAIEAALGWAAPQDVVVIAGRGHETHQQVPGGAIAFSDRAEVHNALGAIRRRMCE